ncbi:hypothetical protein BMD_4435 [Priestia megaterium DSM 319]|uniref:Uncharacterized protein n=1 Tax=Priestia megaterium (strain DSM 319 / IMG 1521) TaxID=592022 RepID=D5DLD7_PRIM3|nr:hypothetical protein BMD_4435 [Priestia megaterium DSM 319]
MEYFIEIIYLIVMRVLCLKEDLEDALKNSSPYFKWDIDK